MPLDLTDRVNELEGELHDSLLPRFRTMEAAVNALVLRSQPHWLIPIFKMPVVWLAVIGFLTAAGAFTLRNVNQVQQNSSRIAVNELAIPAISRNIERLAASLDNLCANLATSQRVRSLQPITCQRTPIEPLIEPHP